MGLDVSHGCWHGAYSAFKRWREMLAKVAGYPPLGMMEGFCSVSGKWSFDEWDELRSHIPSRQWYGDSQLANALKLLWDCFVISDHELPLSWEYYKDDPLTMLLNHSDCDGIIDHKHCLRLAQRIEGLIPLLPEGECPGHIGNWKEKTKLFMDGLMVAHEKNEDIDFH